MIGATWTIFRDWEGLLRKIDLQIIKKVSIKMEQIRIHKKSRKSEKPL